MKGFALSLSLALASAGAVTSTAFADASSAPGLPTRPARKSILATAAAAGTFTTLATALRAADLVGALEGPGPFTVFAPTDEAFAKLPAGTLQALLADVPRLRAVLLLHVARGEFPADRIFLRKEIPVLGGAIGCWGTDKCAFGGRLLLADARGRGGAPARVVTEDVAATNGIIHVLDTVILPASTGH